MIQIKTNLFIGGAFDGQVKKVHQEFYDRGIVVFPVMVPLRAYDAGMEYEESLLPQCAEYRMHAFKADDAIYNIWLAKGLKPKDAMSLLLAAYRPQGAGVTP